MVKSDKMWGKSTLIVLLLFLLAGYTGAASNTLDNLLDFFPSSEGDGLNIIWAHGVNSHEELDQTLQDDTMMLETDIILRGIGTDNQTDIPVNAHPPDTDSDLIVADFINETTRTPGKGMKLDFKYLEAVGPTMELVLEMEDQIKCPLWINADIVKGPNSPKDPILPVDFIETANSYFAETVMSLGFTTSWGVLKPEDLYTWTMIFDILQYTYTLHPQPVTYPIRAIWCVRSWSKFTWLLGLRDTFSITVWTGSSDPVDIQGLISLREHGDIRRIFYDLPTAMRDDFLEGINEGTPKPDEKSPTDWKVDIWKSFSAADSNFVFLSTESAGISGTEHRAGYIQSVNEYRDQSETKITVYGTVQFVDRYDEPSNEAALEIFIRTDEVDGTNPEIFKEPYTPRSVRLQINRQGQMKLGSDSGEDSTATLGEAECYSFEVVDRGDDQPIQAFVTIVTCYDASEPAANVGKNCTLTVQTDDLPPTGDQSFVVVTKRGGTGDVIIENMDISEDEDSSATKLSSTFIVAMMICISVKFMVI